MSAQLKEILDAKALTPQPTDDRLRLREKGVMEVEVVDPPSDLTTVAMEKLGRFSGMKDGEWIQVCDYLLAYPRKGKDHIIFVELKKNLDEDRGKAMEQLRRSLPFLEYLRSVCEIHFGSEQVSRRIAVQYLLIGERMRSRLDKKQSVNPDPARIVETQDYGGIAVTTFVGSRVLFDLLVSQSTRSTHP